MSETLTSPSSGMAERRTAARPVAGVVAITGASSGIGRCTARLFAERGWKVGLIARSPEGLEATREDVEALGRPACVAPADVTDHAALERAAMRIEAELGPIDVWINDAGASFYAPFLEMTEEEFRRVTETTYMGAVNGTRVALARMAARGRGTIVNVGSAVAYRGAPLQSAYSGAKFALRGFTEAVRSELLHNRSPVHLTMVHPPSVNTPFFSHAGARMDGVPRPLPPVYQPEVIADAIHLAATTRRREVKVGGATVQLAWMNKFLPGLSDRLLGLTGYALQRSHDPEVVGRHRPTLFEPDRQPSPVHGPFGRGALAHSAQLWAAKNRGMVAAGLGLAALLLASRAAARSR